MTKDEQKALEKANYLLRKLHGQKATPEKSAQFMQCVGIQRTLVEKKVHEDAEYKYKKDIEPMIKDYIKTPQSKRHLWQGN